MRAILEEAVAVGNATARTLTFAPREWEGLAYYPGSAWYSMLFVGGYEFMDPPPEITADARILLLPGHRQHTRNVHAADRHPLAIPDRHLLFEGSRRVTGATAFPGTRWDWVFLVKPDHETETYSQLDPNPTNDRARSSY